MRSKKIMMTFVALTVSVFLTRPTSIQANEISFIKSYGGAGDDVGRSMTKTEKGEYVIAGNSDSTTGDFSTNKGGFDFFLSKLDSNGNKIWTKTYGGSGTDYLIKIITTQDGGNVSVGTSNSVNGDLPPSKGNNDAIIIKTNKEGKKEWIKSFGGSNYDVFYDIIQTKDGGFVGVGVTRSSNGDLTNNKGDYDSFIVKYDGLGNKTWSKSFGGSLFDEFSDVIELNDNSLIVTGNTESNNGDFPSSKGMSDIAITKLDATGNLIWKKRYGGSMDDDISTIKEMKNGQLIMIGLSESNNGDFNKNNGETDIYIGKLDSNGNTLWIKTYGGNDIELVRDLLVTERGDFIGIGYTNSTIGDFKPSKGMNDVLIVKFTSNGELSWSKTYGSTGGDAGYNIIESSKFQYAFLGFSNVNGGDLGNTNGLSDFKFVTFSETPIGQTNLVSVGIKSGEFTIEQPTLDADFGTISIDQTIHHLYATLGNLTVKDFRAIGDGWNVTVSASPFTAISNPTLTLPTNTLTLHPIDSIEHVVGDTILPNSPLSTSVTIDNGEVKIASSDIGKGTGEYKFIFPLQSLELILDTKSVIIDESLATTEFESILTWNLSTGP